MPKLKTIIETLDGIEDQYHGLYEEKDGKFILQIEGVDDHPAVVALKNGHTNSKRERDQAKRELAEAKAKLAGVPEDFDADEWSRMKAEDDARAADPDGKDIRAKIDTATAAVKTQMQGKIDRLQKEMDTKIAEKDAEIARRDSEIRSRVVTDGVRAALIKAGVKPTMVEDGVRVFDRDVEVVQEDDRYVARMKSDLGGDEIEKYIANWAQSDAAKDWIKPAMSDDERGSTRGRVATSDNPFGKGGWNKTAQGQLFRSNKVKAEQLAKSAGFKNLDAALASRGPVAA